MSRIGRRGFVKSVGLGIGLLGVGVVPGSSATNKEGALGHPSGEDVFRSSSDPHLLYNVNLQTAIGLGNERASVVDGFGQMKSRHVWVDYEIGTPRKRVAELESSQRLEDGYLPVVHTTLRSPSGEMSSVAFSSDVEGIKSDYWGLDLAQPCTVTLWFPDALSATATNGVVMSENRVLAILPKTNKIRTTRAKYNCLSLTDDPPSTGGKQFPHLDKAFSGSRHAAGFIGSGNVGYSFPVANGQTYYVYLGVMNTGNTQPGTVILDFYVNGQKQTVDVGVGAAGQPILKEFILKPHGELLNIKVDCNPSSTSPYRPIFINGIWIFRAAADPKRIVTGALNRQAVFYVPCGREAKEDLASSVVLEFTQQKGVQRKAWFKFPYETTVPESERLREVSPSAALSTAKQRWNTFLDKGASFTTGIPRLDNLYKTSLINVFLLRTRHPHGTSSGEDIYVVKPGCTIYDGFWYRDGSYIVNAFDSAGHSDLAEQSLRLFWTPDLESSLRNLSQEPSGAWSRPIDEWDGQGQALWALVRHYQVTGDKDWLKKVYPAVRRGARWIREATTRTKVLGENGVKPIYYGLLPVGEGEDITYGYIYYHDFWAVLGFKMALLASEALGEEADHAWMRKCYDEFTANLHSSIEQAYQQVGKNTSIPATPYNPEVPIWGALAAIYPCEFLDPRDPMMTATLDRIEKHSQEGLYTYVEDPARRDKKMWTYITTDWAMCYMVRDELSKFQWLFSGYVDHASPTNAWIEEIWIKSRIGTGDMPHGWAAADYVLLHRQALVWEMENKLHLCWGASADWLSEGKGIVVKNAPTQFGTLNFQLKRSSPSALTFQNSLRAHPNQGKAEEIILHVPPELGKSLKSIEINGKAHPWSPGQTVIPI